jgi:hypothetical protein
MQFFYGAGATKKHDSFLTCTFAVIDNEKYGDCLTIENHFL